MVKKDFLTCIQSRVARVAIGPSTVRGRGNAGVVLAAREFLRTLALEDFGTDAPDRFQQRLDQATEALRLVLPEGAQYWGIARKALNIFLRDSVYTVYLRDEYGLARTEPLLEIPLDSITTKRIRADLGRGELPRWKGVKWLRPNESAIYQKAAARIADDRGIVRAHLDALWWSVDRDGAAQT
jgi:hypothetical protein